MIDFISFRHHNPETGQLELLTMKNGSTEKFYKHKATDEGWKTVQLVYSYDGKEIRRELEIEEKDCDGKVSRSQVHTCQKEDVAAAERYTTTGSSIRLPLWVLQV